MSNQNLEDDYDSEEDDDFVPQGDDGGSDDDALDAGSDDENDPGTPASKRRKLNSATASSSSKSGSKSNLGRSTRKKSSGLVLSDEEDAGDGEDIPEPEEPEIDEPVQPTPPKKVNSDVDDLWASLNKKSSSTSLPQAASASPVASPKPPVTAPSSVDDIWAALNSKKPSTPSPAASKPALQSTPTAKLGIPASWLSDSPKPAASSPSPAASTIPQTDSSNSQEPGEMEPEKKSIVVTEKYDFAGETITVTKEVPLEALKPGRGRGSAPNVPASGLGNILADMKGKKKMSALQKSALDWQGVRNQDEEMKAELEKNKKDGYLEKQAFLSRTDWRQFENERDERSKGRRASSGGSGGGL